MAGTGHRAGRDPVGTLRELIQHSFVQFVVVRQHGGVIFVDEKSIVPSDIGGLVLALNDLYQQAGKWDWTDRICFLQR